MNTPQESCDDAAPAAPPAAQESDQTQPRHGSPRGAHQGSRGPRRQSRRRVALRTTTLLVFVIAGGLFATSALNSRGLDLRASSVTDLDTVVRQAATRTDGLQQRVADLNKEVNRLGSTVDDTEVRRAQRAVKEISGPAAFAPVRGRGVTVTLEDAPQSVRDEAVQSGSVPVEQLLVHQQDIQAVVNALWAGGAEAMTLQRQRVINTTGIKCVGNTVRLHGVTYAPPYVISAIGDPASLARALDEDPYVQGYRRYSTTYQLGYAARAERLALPAYDGSADLRYASVAPASP